MQIKFDFLQFLLHIIAMKSLRFLREKNNLSQQQLADYLQVSRQMYLKYESEEVDPPLKVITLLSRLYKVDYNHLINDEAGTAICYKKNFSFVVEESAPAFGSEIKTFSRENLFQKKLETFSEEQKKLVFNLIESISNMNKGFLNSKKQRYREPGIMKSSVYMSPDFDETPECFKDYL